MYEISPRAARASAQVHTQAVCGEGRAGGRLWAGKATRDSQHQFYHHHPKTDPAHLQHFDLSLMSKRDHK